MNAPNLPQASAVEVSSGANITVVGCGMGRTNAEGVDEALRSNSAAFRHASRKSDVLRTTWSAASTNTRASRSRLYASHGGNRDRGARNLGAQARGRYPRWHGHAVAQRRETRVITTGRANNTGSHMRHITC